MFIMMKKTLKTLSLMAVTSFASVGISHAHSGNFNEWQSDSTVEMNTVPQAEPIILAEAKTTASTESGSTLRIPAEATTSASLRPVMRSDTSTTAEPQDVQTVASVSKKRPKVTRSSVANEPITDPIRASKILGVYH